MSQERVTVGERIAQEFLGLWKCDMPKKLKLAKAIDQACAEAYKRGQSDECYWWSNADQNDADHKAYVKGFADGVEEAAKVCDQRNQSDEPMPTELRSFDLC